MGRRPEGIAHTPRSTIEVSPIVRKAIKVIAKKRKVRIKVASDLLLRFAIPYEDTVFKNDSSGGKSTLESNNPNTTRKTTK